MDWKDVGKGIAAVAPTLATALGGPAGVIVGGAVKVLTSFLGLGDDATPETVQAELAKLTPEQYVELRKQDNAFKQSLMDAGVKLEEIAMQDRASARQIYDSSKTMTNILAGLIVSGWIALNWFIFSAPEKLANMDLILRTMGTIDMAVGGVIYFFFGSSRGSEKLKDILAAGGK